MALRRGFSQGRRPPANRRVTTWGNGPGGSAVTQFATDVSTILGSGVILTVEDRATIVRVRGNLQAYLRSATGADDGYHCALGIGLVSSDAFGIGVTAVPNPLDDVDWPGWLYHRYFDVHGSAAFAADDSAGKLSFEVDSKAMRKWGANETLMANLQVVEEVGSTLSVWFDSRVLVKLH